MTENIKVGKNKRTIFFREDLKIYIIGGGCWRHHRITIIRYLSHFATKVRWGWGLGPNVTDITFFKSLKNSKNDMNISKPSDKLQCINKLICRKILTLVATFMIKLLSLEVFTSKHYVILLNPLSTGRGGGIWPPESRFLLWWPAMKFWWTLTHL